jgi:glycosyltransferase involved in cell wall biosynthesis
MKGIPGHLWEQVCLPAKLRGRALWSPNCTGPLSIHNQVCTFHDVIALERPDWFSPTFAAWYGWLLPKLARRVTHIIAVSEFTKTRLTELIGIDPRKVTVIPNGVDERFRKQEPGAIANVRQQLGINSEQYVLCLGSIEPRKNLSRLLEAWSALSPDIKRGISLVVAGGKSAVFSKMSITGISPDVHFTGYVEEDQLPALYSGALALVFPSLYE